MSKQFNPVILYEDRPGIDETFADSIHGLIFDGQTMRIEFTTTRMDPPQPEQNPIARQYTVCRLVMPPTAAIDLYNRLQQILQASESIRNAMDENFFA